MRMMVVFVFLLSLPSFCIAQDTEDKTLEEIGQLHKPFSSISDFSLSL